MDGFYCVPQTLGLVRGEPKEGAKNRANGEAIMREAMYERASRSPTLDRSRSGKNEYWGKVGVKSLGGDHWAWTEARADEWRSTYTDKNGKERSRRLPRQSVIAIATIVKAPAEVTAGWDKPTRERFFADAADALQECDPVFYNPANTIYRAVHRDEADGCHVHFAHEARDKDGRYCGSRYDAKWRQGLAAAFAKKMREKGWSVLNPKLTDWERYRSVRKARPGERGFLLDRARCGLEAGTRVAWADPDYRLEVDERRRRQGLSVEEHHARMEQAKELEAAKAEQAAAEKARDDAKAVTAQAVQAKTDADAALGEAQEAVKKAQDAQDEAERKAGEAQEAAEKAKSNLEKLEGDATFIDPETNEKRVGIKGAKRELADLTTQRNDLKQEVTDLTTRRSEVEQALNAAGTRLGQVQSRLQAIEGDKEFNDQGRTRMGLRMAERILRAAERARDTALEALADAKDGLWDMLRPLVVNIAVIAVEQLVRERRQPTRENIEYECDQAFDEVVHGWGRNEQER